MIIIRKITTVVILVILLAIIAFGEKSLLDIYLNKYLRDDCTEQGATPEVAEMAMLSAIPLVDTGYSSNGEHKIKIDKYYPTMVFDEIVMRRCIVWASRQLNSPEVRATAYNSSGVLYTHSYQVALVQLAIFRYKVEKGLICVNEP